jgi:hypothetical protein
LIRIIKNYLLDKLLVNRFFLAKQKNEITDYSRQLSEAKKILIILPVIHQNVQLINDFKTNLANAFPKSSISTFGITSLRKSDMNWLGVPGKEYLNRIREEDFNLLIDLNEDQDRVCTYLSALSNAPLRIHFSEGKFDKIYNLQIRTDINVSLNTKIQTLTNYLIKFSKIEKVML